MSRPAFIIFFEYTPKFKFLVRSLTAKRNDRVYDAKNVKSIQIIDTQTEHFMATIGLWFLTDKNWLLF